MSSVWLRGGILVTMDPQRRIMRGDVLVRAGRIAAVGPDLQPELTGPAAGTPGEVPRDAAATPGELPRVIDVTGMVVLPGLVQTHIHLCQTLLRGQADDLELLDWLKRRIWPLEAAHSPDTLQASARLGCAELILGGTTTIVDMGTVHHTDAIFHAIASSGLRAYAGKCMMDHGDEVPPGLREDGSDSLEQSLDLLERWDGAAGGRIRYCFAPRFAISCTDGLLRAVQRAAADRGCLIHTHAAENRGECALVEAEHGCRNVEYFHQLGMTGPRLLLAHCVHLSEDEKRLLAATDTRVAHCPSSNLKLASGIAPVADLLQRGIKVGLGADGAPCNNNLDGFQEMRLAALLQKVAAGPTALTAPQALEMATLGGARAIGLESEIGSLEVGKQADIIAIDLSGLHCAPVDPGDRQCVISAVVYAARAGDVRLTMVAGDLLMQDRRLLTLDAAEVSTLAMTAVAELRARAGQANQAPSSEFS